MILWTDEVAIPSFLFLVRVDEQRNSEMMIIEEIDLIFEEEPVLMRKQFVVIHLLKRAILAIAYVHVRDHQGSKL